MEAFRPWGGDREYGDAVNFTWRLLKAGYGAALFRHVMEWVTFYCDRGKDRETRRHVERWRKTKAKSEGRKKKK